MVRTWSLFCHEHFPLRTKRKHVTVAARIRADSNETCRVQSPLPSVMGPPRQAQDSCASAATRPESGKTVPASAASGRDVDAGSGVGVWSGAGDRLVRRSDLKSLARRTRRSPAGLTPFRFRSRPCPPVSGKVRFSSAAGHLPSVRGRLVGRLHDAWSNPAPECQSHQRARTRQRGSATRCRNGAANQVDVGRVW